ncbi:unnamed protein product [Cylicostephanus goldi]|uniref:Uncharacterized protein n=1 Tax=Cylicostephanus goldi TaxID=71465 RepID=A0A3P6QAN3_CYLGO|nr:unnamed protein product [Cylicostephanus goldi]
MFATFEYNFQVPETLRHASEDKKEEAFAAFWNSGVPRFGDEGAKGWFSFLENHEAQEADRLEVVARALQEQKTQELEQRIAASEDDLIVSWVEMERELECIESRPRRALSGSLAGIDSIHAMKEVGYGDLRILKSNNPIFVLSLLHVLGARCGTEWWSTPDMPLPRLPTFRLLEEWNLLPSVRKLYPIPSPGAQEMVLNMLRAAIHLLPDLKYIVYLLETKASQLEYLYRDRPTGVCVAHMRDFVRSIAKDYQSVVDIKDFDLIIAAYALKIFERWARDEKASSSLTEGGEAAKDKKKKKEKNFLRSHYVEQLSAFLSNSNEVPFVQQSPRKLVVLLRMLLCLVQNLPHHRVLAEITRFFLRKKKDEEVSPTEALSALDEWNNIFRTVERFDRPDV